MLTKKEVIYSTLIVFLFGLYSFFFLKPDLYKYFSLIDDGQMINNSILVKNCLFGSSDCNTTIFNVFIERDFGRVRPLYWIFNSIVFYVSGGSPIVMHFIRIYLIGFLAVFSLVCLSVKLKNSFWGTLVAVFLYLTSISYAENYIRLGPVEPYMVLVYSLLFLYSYKKDSFQIINLKTIFFIFCCILLKETGLAISFSFFIISFLSNGRRSVSKSFYLLSPAIFFFILKLLAGSGNLSGYSNNFSISFHGFVSNLHLYVSMLTLRLGPVLFVLALLSPVILAKKLERDAYLLLIRIYVFAVSYLFIISPWQYVLERYLLPVLFFSAIMGSTALFYILEQIGIFIYKKFFIKVIYVLCCCIVVLNLVVPVAAKQYPDIFNYTRWFSSFINSDFDQVREFSYKYPNVCFNMTDDLNSWEFKYQMLHFLRLYYDVISPVVMHCTNDIKPGIWAYSRSGVSRIINLQPVDEVSKGYLTEQVDSAKFFEQFTFNPVKTFLNPPLKNSIYLSWSLERL